MFFKFKKSGSSRREGRRGQVMLLTTITLSGALLGATTIAGLLMYYQIRQSTDIANSTKAIFAADGGLEWGLFAATCGTVTPNRCVGGAPARPAYLNGVRVASVICRDLGGAALASCEDPLVRRIDVVGSAGNSSRALQASL